MAIKPRQPAPALEFDTLDGGRWSLAAQRPQNFTMVVVYRGLHCPVCRRYTSELNGMIDDFTKRGVSTVITSTDPKERAEQAKTQWGLPKLTIGYGVSIEKAREWGLYISTSRGVTSAGLLTFWIQRSTAEPPEKLGFAADHVVKVLTELTQLVRG